MLLRMKSTFTVWRIEQLPRASFKKTHTHTQLVQRDWTTLVVIQTLYCNVMYHVPGQSDAYLLYKQNNCEKTYSHLLPANRPFPSPVKWQSQRPLREMYISPLGVWLNCVIARYSVINSQKWWTTVHQFYLLAMQALLPFPAPCRPMKHDWLTGWQRKCWLQRIISSEGD